MKDKKIYIVLVISIMLTIIGVSLAYFSLEVEGTGKDIVMSTGDLRLEYKDETELKLENAFPGDSVTKIITVKNIGTREVSYNIAWMELTNTIINNELVIDGTCRSLNSNDIEEDTCNPISKKFVKEGNVTSNITIKPGYTHEYIVKVTFIDTGKSQNYNKNKTFNGKLGISESTAKTVYCTFDGELTQGVTYANGQYTYTYTQDSGSDGWEVRLTDYDSTDPITSDVCTYINDKPIISMASMFHGSEATEINLSSFNTSNVTNMNNMFYGSKCSNIDVSSFNTANVTNMSDMFMAFLSENAVISGLENFDTSKVTDMSGMFSWCGSTTLDVSNFNTSNVTTMANMFSLNVALLLDVSNFDTSKVTNMSNMFSSSSATEIKGIENFDTSNVTSMESMFSSSEVLSLDLSNFDTSNVTNMNYMFFASKATSINVSNFDTSKITNLIQMFQESNLKSIDLSSFDTSKVTNMRLMFKDSTNLETIYVSNKFTTSNVTYSGEMFTGCTNLVGGSGSKYNSSYVDKTYARVDGGTGSPGYFTLKQ